MTPALQLGGQLTVVVDLTVVDDLDAPVLVGHRLPAAGREIDQGEPAMHELAARIAPVPLAIRPAMGEEGGGARTPPRRFGKRHGVKPAGYAAHGRSDGLMGSPGAKCKRRTPSLCP